MPSNNLVGEHSGRIKKKKDQSLIFYLIILASIGYEFLQISLIMSYVDISI